MIDFLKSWVNQIIVAVIIATIFEMLLPNGNNKKYIKIIIGLYVLFTIIQPIITRVTGNSLEISSFNYKKYFDEDVIGTSSNNFEDNNSKLIEQAYKDNIKDDVIVKIKQKGYEVISLKIDIIEDRTLNRYGLIENISLKIEKIDDKESNYDTNTIKIENVDINEIGTDTNITNNIEESNVSEKEKKDIIKYLADEYSIDMKNIIID